MGMGINLATEDPELRKALEELRDQALVAFVVKAGGKFTISVDDVDATGKYVMMVAVDQAKRTFTFETKEKQ